VSGAEVVLTRSGALAMLDRRSGEVMHPIGGPLLESERLYVAASGLAQRLSIAGREPLRLLDVGLGAGSNASAAIRLRQALAVDARRLEIVSIDRSLEAFQLALAPDNAAAFGWVGAARGAACALAADGVHVSAAIEWRLHVADVLEALAREPAASVDVVFWDPFSPAANPELWTLAAFTALRRVCRAGSTVHTYSGATAVRSALLLAGFRVGVGEKIAEGKQATVAALDPARLAQPLDARWLERLGRSSAPFPSDAPPDALARVCAHPQFAEITAPAAASAPASVAANLCPGNAESDQHQSQ
jgi:queuine tRNA-ribosyltransferase